MNTYLKTGILLACMAVPTGLMADGYKQIKTEAEFRQSVAGKKLWWQGNHVTARANGALVGNFSGKRLKGAWAWRDQYWCRTLTTHSKNTDCQVWETDGSSFRVTRAKGKGSSYTYTLSK